MKYDIWCGKCSSGIKCEIDNLDTEERITIDESYEDVKKLYEVLKQFFECGEKDVKSWVYSEKPNVIEYPDIDKPEEYMRVRKDEWDRMIKRVAELELLVKEYNKVFQYAGWDSWKSRGDK